MSWWVSIDFGADHAIVESDEKPRTGNRAPWQGPYRTFTEARQVVLEVGAAEIAQLRDKQAWWRTASKAEILKDDMS